MRRSLLATTFGLFAIAAAAGATTLPARHTAPGRAVTSQAHDHASSSSKKKSKAKTTTATPDTAAPPATTAPAPSTKPAKPHDKK